MSTPKPPPALERRSVLHPGVRHQPHRFLVQGVLEFLQLYYSAQPIDSPYRYSPDEHDTRLLIHDKGAFKLENVGQIPALVTHRKQVRWGNEGGINRLKAYDLRTGAKHHHSMEHGAVVVHAITEDSMTADELGGDVYRLFTELSDYLRKISFFKVEATGIDEEQKIKVGAEELRVVVSVTIVASWQRSWTTVERTPSALAKILMRMQES